MQSEVGAQLLPPPPHSNRIINFSERKRERTRKRERKKLRFRAEIKKHDIRLWLPISPLYPKNRREQTWKLYEQTVDKSKADF